MDTRTLLAKIETIYKPEGSHGPASNNLCHWSRSTGSRLWLPGKISQLTSFVVCCEINADEREQRVDMMSLGTIMN